VLQREERVDAAPAWANGSQSVERFGGGQGGQGGLQSPPGGGPFVDAKSERGLQQEGLDRGVRNQRRNLARMSCASSPSRSGG
jgi:hypothetical protein